MSEFSAKASSLVGRRENRKASDEYKILAGKLWKKEGIQMRKIVIGITMLLAISLLAVPQLL